MKELSLSKHKSLYLPLILLIALLPLLQLTMAKVETDTVSCPRLTCSEDLGTGVCFMHSATNPVEWIKLAGCPNG